MRSNSSSIPFNILLLLLTASAAEARSKTIFHDTPSYNLARSLAKNIAFDHFIQSSRVFNDLPWFLHDPGLLCEPTNTVHEQIEEGDNKTELVLTVTQPCADANVPLKDVQVSLDHSRRLSVSANITSGHGSSFIKHYRLPSLAASDRITATYTADRVLRVSIPHLAPSDLISTEIPVAVEPEPEQEEALVEHAPTDSEEPQSVPLTGEQSGDAATAVESEVERSKSSGYSRAALPTASSKLAEPSATQPSTTNKAAHNDEEIRAFLKDYEGKIQQYKAELEQIAARREASSSTEFGAISNTEPEQPYYSKPAMGAASHNSRAASEVPSQQHQDDNSNNNHKAAPVEGRSSEEQKRKKHARAGTSSEAGRTNTAAKSEPTIVSEGGKRMTDKTATAENPTQAKEQGERQFGQRGAGGDSTAKSRRERVGGRGKLATEDPYRPVPTRKAIKQAEAEASARGGKGSEDVKANVVRLEEELKRLAALVGSK